MFGNSMRIETQEMLAILKQETIPSHTRGISNNMSSLARVF